MRGIIIKKIKVGLIGIGRFSEKSNRESCPRWKIHYIRKARSEVLLHLQMSKTAGVTLQEIEALSEIIAKYVSPEAANSLCVEARKIFV